MACISDDVPYTKILVILLTKPILKHKRWHKQIVEILCILRHEYIMYKSLKKAY